MVKVTYKTIFFFLFLTLFLLSSISFIIFQYMVDSNVIIDSIRLDKYNIYYDNFRVLFALFTALVSLIIVKKFAIGKSLIFTPTFLFFFILLFLVYPGVILTSDHTLNGKTAVYGYALSLLAFSIGISLSSIINNFNPKIELIEFRKKIAESKIIDKSKLIWLFIVSVISVMLIIAIDLFFSRTNNFLALNGIIDFMKNGIVPDISSDVSELRKFQYEFGKTNLEVIRNYLVKIVVPISAIIFILYGIESKDKRVKVFGLALFTFVLLAAIGTGSRLLLGHIILYSVVCYSFFRTINIRQVITIIISLLTLLILQTITLGRMSGGETLLQNIIMSFNRVLERIFLTKGAVTARVFEYFPDILDFRWGTTVLQPLLGRFSKQENLANEMYYLYTGGSGTAGPQAIGELYVNFGLFGMIFGSFLLGIVIQFITIKIVRMKKADIYKISIISYFTFLIGLTGYSGLMASKTNGIHVLIFYITVNFVVFSIVKSTIVQKGTISLQNGGTSQ